MIKKTKKKTVFISKGNNVKNKKNPKSYETKHVFDDYNDFPGALDRLQCILMRILFLAFFENNCEF